MNQPPYAINVTNDHVNTYSSTQEPLGAFFIIEDARQRFTHSPRYFWLQWRILAILAFISALACVIPGISSVHAQTSTCVSGNVDNDNTDMWSEECYLDATCGLQGNPCQANDVNLIGAFLADEFGDPLDICTGNDPMAAYLWGTFVNGTNSNRYAVRSRAEILIDGVYNTELLSCSFDVLSPGQENHALLGVFYFTCHQQVQLTNIWVGWDVSAAQCSNPAGANYIGTCGKYPPSKCSKDLDTINFLAPNFTFSCGLASQTTTEICFFDMTQGGEPPYTYEWDFGDGNMSTDQNPCHTFSATTGDYDVTLYVTDANGVIAGAIFNADLDSLNCCELVIVCPPEFPDPVSCPEDVPAPDTSVVVVSDSCGPIDVSITEGTHGSGCPGDTLLITRTYYVSDGSDMDSCTQVFRVVDDVSPLITCPADVTVQCAEDIPTADIDDVTVSDNCLAGATVEHVGDASDEESCPEAIVRTYRATDACGNSATCTQRIVIDDVTPPGITCPADVTVQCAEDIPTADIDDVTVSDNCLAGATVEHVGDASDEESCPEVIIRTYRATDACGNSVTCTQVITVDDLEDPVITCLGPVTVSCIEEVPAADISDVTVSDNCAVGATVEHVSDVSDDASCPEVIVRTYRATDACGNSTTCTQRIVIDDVTPPGITCPADVTVQCAEDIPTADIDDVTVSDNCLAGATVEHVGDASDEESCPEVIVRTYRATDACDNSVTCTQRIVIDDITPPQIACPVGVTVQCIEDIPAPNIADVTVSDNCTAGVTVVHLDDESDNATCPQIITRTYLVIDLCGNSITCTQLITIDDTTPPLITGAQDQAVECNGAGNQSQLAGWLAGNAGATASDNCGTVTWSNDYSGLNAGCGSTGAVTVTFTATDACSNATSTTATFTIEDTTAPEVTPATDETVECDGAGNTSELSAWLANNGGATASDDCGAVTWSNDYDSLSDGCGATGAVTVTFTATDACGNTASTTATFTIEDTTAPDVTPAADAMVECDGAGNAAELDAWLANHGGATASDACGAVTWSNDYDGLSDGCGATGTATVTFTATDACGNATSTTATFTIEDTTAPDVTPAADAMVECDGAGNAAELDAWLANHGGATASDACGAVTWSNDYDGLSDGCGATGAVTVTFTATDACGNATSTTATFTIEDTTAPDVTAAADAMVECDGAGNAAEVDAWLANHGGATASDACGAVTWSNDYDGLSDGCGATGAVTVTFTATDACGNATSTTATFTIEDTTAPDVTPAADETVECDGAGNTSELNAWLANNGSATASDACSAVTWSNDYDGLSDGCGATGTVTVTFTATDACGNAASTSATFTIEDTTAPEISPAADETVECDGAGNTPELNTWIANNGGATASDACGAVTWSNDYESLSDGCGATGAVTVTFTATDACGNAASTTATFTIEDTTAPEVTPAANATVECDGAGNAVELDTWLANNGGATASDACGAMTWSNDYDGLSDGCGATGTVTVTYTATDACGNATSTTATFTIGDMTAPELSACGPQDLTIECDPASNEATADAWNTTNINSLEDCATDDCTADFTSLVTSDYNFNNLTSLCGGTGVLVVNYIVSDACGNTAVFEATLTINDTSPPAIEFMDPMIAGLQSGDVMQIQCYGQDTTWTPPMMNASSVQASDCDPAASVTFSEALVGNGDCPADGYFKKWKCIWTATDACGNTAEAFLFVEIVDQVPPQLFGVPKDITVSCSEMPATGEVVATDECLCVHMDFAESALQPGCLDGQVMSRTWTAYDHCGNVAVGIQNITLTDSEGPQMAFVTPELAGQPDGAVLEFDCNNGGYPQWLLDLNEEAVSARDGCSPTPGITLTSSSYTPLHCDFAGFIEERTFVWEAEDACGNTSNHILVARLIDNTPPTIIGVSDYLCNNDAQLDNIYAVDNCSNASMSYWETQVDSECGPATLRTYEASDACGNMAIAEVMILPNEMVSLKGIYFDHPDLNALEDGAVVELPCETDVESYFGPDAVGVNSDCPLGMEVSFTGTEAVSENCVEDGFRSVMQLTWTATDACGSRFSLNISVQLTDDEPPVLVDFEEEITVSCINDIPEIVAIDNCSEVDLGVIATHTPGTCPLVETIQRDIIATDACGNRLIAKQVIRIIDDVGPEMTEVPEYVCEDTKVAAVEATDECTGEPLEVVLTETVDDANCSSGFLIERVWEAVDACGNVSQVIQYVIPNDSTPPAMIVANGDLWNFLNDVLKVYLSDEETMAQLEGFNFASVLGEDDCNMDIIADFGVAVKYPSASCKEAGFSERRTYAWTFTDACGNSASTGFQVDIIDDIAPVIIDPPQDKTVICAPWPEAAGIEVFDHSPFTVSYHEEILPNVNNGVMIIRTWTVTDDCGNVAEHTQHILYIEDTQVSCEITGKFAVPCNSHKNPFTAEVAGGIGPYTYEWTVIDGDCLIEQGQGTKTILIYVGFSEVTLGVTVTDAYGCQGYCQVTFDCVKKGTQVQPIMLPAGSRPGSLIAEQKEISDITDMQFYPNPVSDEGILALTALHRSCVELVVVNVLGLEVQSTPLEVFPGNNHTTIDMRSLSPGAYRIRLQGTNHEMTFIKIE